MVSEQELSEYKKQLNHNGVSLERSKVLKLIDEIERLKANLNHYKSLNIINTRTINELTNPEFRNRKNKK